MAQFIGFGNGKDGTIPASGGYNGSRSPCSGSSGSKTLTKNAGAGFTSGDIVIIHQTRGTGAGAWEFNQVDTDSGSTMSLVYNLSNTYTNSGNSVAQVMEVKEWVGGNVTGTYSATGWDNSSGGIIPILSTGKITVTGSITAAGAGFVGTNGGNPGGDVPGFQGESISGAGGTQSQSANGSGGGGGGSGNTGGGGGGGGHDGAGANGTGNGGVGTGGSGTIGSADLTTMQFGGAGGSGGKHSGNPSHVIGRGGYGGGIVLIFAREIDCSSGSITAAGENGVNAIPVSGGDVTQGVGGGGGGAGGSVFLKAQKLTIGTDKVSALYGTGGTGRNDTSSVTCNGGIGGHGRIRLEACDIVGSTGNPTSSDVEGGFGFCGSLTGIIG